MHRVARIVAASRPGAELPALIIRLAAGAVFVGFSLGKFLRYDAERDAFDRYGIPFPDAATYLIGALELTGGVALILGLVMRPFALALAGNMMGAITTAGRIEGGPVHLVLAPALLACMLFLLWAGPGRRSVDARLWRPPEVSPSA